MNHNTLKIELMFFSGSITHMLQILVCVRSYNITSMFIVSVENMHRLPMRTHLNNFFEKDPYKNIATVFLKKDFNDF